MTDSLKKLLTIDADEFEAEKKLVAEEEFEHEPQNKGVWLERAVEVFAAATNLEKS